MSYFHLPKGKHLPTLTLTSRPPTTKLPTSKTSHALCWLSPSSRAEPSPNLSYATYDGHSYITSYQTWRSFCRIQHSKATQQDTPIPTLLHPQHRIVTTWGLSRFSPYCKLKTGRPRRLILCNAIERVNMYVYVCHLTWPPDPSSSAFWQQFEQSVGDALLDSTYV